MNLIKILKNYRESNVIKIMPSLVVKILNVIYKKN